MKYNIKLTEEFLNEIEDICSYISVSLNANDAANELRKKVMHNILLLENLPRMFAEIEKIDKVKRRYRKIVINNYVILYTIDEKNKIVYIAHIYYSGRNYIDDLL